MNMCSIDLWRDCLTVLDKNAYYFTETIVYIRGNLWKMQNLKFAKCKFYSLKKISKAKWNALHEAGD